jgi:hypothetical protein
VKELIAQAIELPEMDAQPRHSTGDAGEILGMLPCVRAFYILLIIFFSIEGFRGHGPI